jgi:hypothetical protein
MDIRHVYYIAAIISMLVVATIALSACAPLPHEWNLPPLPQPNWP